MCHFVNDFSIDQYNRLRKAITNNYDIFYCTDAKYEKEITSKGISNICYNSSKILSKDGAWNPFLILETAFAKIQKYDYYYLIEYDVYCNDWNNLFKELEKSTDDLLAAYIKKLSYSSNTEWMWVNNYVSEHPVCLDDNIEYMLKSCVSFLRVSQSAIDFISNYDKSDIVNYIYEMYIPTLLYNYGFSVKSLSSDQHEDDGEFNYKNFIEPKNYYHSLSFNNYKTMDKIADDEIKLFTCYKEQKALDIKRTINDGIKLSIVMPVYNGEKYLKEAIDSVFNQKDAPLFEFIIINDGSTDNSKEIIQSYKDDRIVYIELDHSGIVNALNTGIKNSIGEYIVRFDCDDIMYENRLKHQYEYMEIHDDIDILSSGFEWGNNKPEKEYFSYNIPNVTLTQLMKNNCIAHPTIIMRRSSIDKLPYLYESYFEKCEDYKLWCTAASYGLKISLENTVVLYYRQHTGQETQSSSDIMWTNTARIKHAYNNKGNDGPITIIIPFKNEGEEIEKTVCSIRCTTTNLPIILINDGSTDKYDYKKMADFWNCEYIEHKESIGVAQSRDKGVALSKTEYFILLDGHMRFYEDNWDNKLLKLMQENPKSILSAETVIINKDEDGCYSNEAGHNLSHTAGAYINFNESGYEHTAKWTHKYHPDYDGKKLEVIPTPALMGACYCSNKTWWNHIGGLKGLILWGQDEPLISIKTWLAGGQILQLPNFYAGHIYRKKAPYPFISNKIYANSIFLNWFFGETEEDINRYNNHLKKRIGEKCYEESYQNALPQMEKLKNYKKEFFEKTAIHDIKWFKEFNDKCYKK